MPQHRLHVDFSSKDEYGRIVLGTTPTMTDVKGQRIKLGEGLTLTLCSGGVEVPAVLLYRNHLWVASICNPPSEWGSAS